MLPKGAISTKTDTAGNTDGKKIWREWMRKNFVTVRLTWYEITINYDL